MKVTLRKFSLKDAKNLQQLFLNEKDLSHTGANVEHKKITLEFVRDWLKEYIEMYSAKEPSFVSYAVINKSGEHIGNIGMGNIDCVKHSAEIGYWIAEAYAGKGYGTLAVKLFLQKAAKLFGMKHILAEVDFKNIGSQKVLEKCGFGIESKTKEKIVYVLELV